MSTIEDGGCAFPTMRKAEAVYEYPGGETLLVNAVHSGAEGISVRDYFAAKAMQGMLADPETRETCMDGREAEWARSFTCSCYFIADAMLNARKADPKA